MTFVKAAEPFLAETYNFDGYVGTDGTVRNGGLGCSGYAVAVLYRMQHGSAWLKQYQQDWTTDKKPHQWYGDKIARHFGIPLAMKLTASDAASIDKTRELVTTGKLKANGLYFFNVRSGQHGHVGFIRVKPDGRMIQSHYSAVTGYNGLATGDFRKWKQASRYKHTHVDVYLIVE